MTAVALSVNVTETRPERLPRHRIEAGELSPSFPRRDPAALRAAAPPELCVCKRTRALCVQADQCPLGATQGTLPTPRSAAPLGTGGFPLWKPQTIGPRSP